MTRGPLRNPTWIHTVLLIVLGAALYLPALGKVGLLDPSEPFYALTAREMLQRGDLATPVIFGAPQFEKPPLTYWLIAASYRIHGESEMAARLPSAILAILLVLVTYAVGRRLLDRPVTALAGAVMLATAGKTVALARLAFTDIALALCIWVSVWGATLVFFGRRRPALGWIVYWTAAGAGLLVKGPVALIVPSMAVWAFALTSGRKREIRPAHYAAGYALFVILVVPWYTLMTVRHGSGFLYDFFVHENLRRFFVAEHGGSDRWHFYPLAVLIGLWPWSALVPMALARAAHLARRPTAGLPEAAKLLGGLTLTSAVFFTLAKSKLVSYIYPIYPALTLLTALWLTETLRGARLSGALRNYLFVLWVIAPIAGATALAVYVTRTGLADALIPALLAGLGLTAMGTLLYTAVLRGARGAAAPAAAAVLSCVALVWVAYSQVLPAVERRFSSRPWAEEARRLGLGGAVTSKMCVRGVSFYTGVPRPVVVAGDGMRAFYTPHALEAVADTPGLLGQPGLVWPVAGYLRDKEIRMLEVSSNGRLRITEIDSDAKRSLVRLEPAR